MSPRRRVALGVRATSTVSFAAMALAVSALLSVGTYLTARHFLVQQREATAERQAFVDAALLREGLRTSGTTVSEVLDETASPPGAVIVVNRGGQWYASTLEAGTESVPRAVRDAVSEGRAVRAWSRLAGEPVVVVGVPVPAVGVEFFELSPTVELQSTLRTLAAVLASFAVVTTLGGALIGRSASRRVVAPLREVAAAAASIADGRMSTRLTETEDPDLTVIVGSFNAMVEALDERMKRDARFAADVAHELRSPVTTMMTSLSVLESTPAADEGRRRAATDLVHAEVRRLHRSLEHLLELGRLDAGVLEVDGEPVDLVGLVRHSLAETHREVELSILASGLFLVRGSKARLHRAVVNLLDNADLHGGGVVSVGIDRRGDRVRVSVVDRGPGVPAAERERVFERFARVGSRGSTPGSGLGLSLVAETARAHGGTVGYEDTPGGGSTFVLTLPLIGPARRAQR